MAQDVSLLAVQKSIRAEAAGMPNGAELSPTIIGVGRRATWIDAGGHRSIRGVVSKRNPIAGPVGCPHEAMLGVVAKLIGVAVCVHSANKPVLRIVEKAVREIQRINCAQQVMPAIINEAIGLP